MEKLVKFTHLIHGKKLSVTYYQDKRLKKLDGLKKRVYPIYLKISFNNSSHNLRSIFWKRVMEGRNDFAASVTFNKGSIIEGYLDFETYLINDKKSFEQACAYEMECIKRIIVFALRSSPNDVKQIAEAYNFWGQDGLREISLNIIKSLIGTDEEPDNRTFAVVTRTHNSLSKNARNIITTLLENDYDPVSILSFIDEMGIISILEKNLSVNVKDGFYRTVHLIGILIQNLQPSEAFKTPIPFGIYYFPKIHFFLPLSDNHSTGAPRKFSINESLKSIDLLKLQTFLKAS